MPKLILKVKKSVYLKYFLSFILIYTIALFSLIRANYNYIDDLGRSYCGYRIFGFSRVTSNFLSIFVHGSKYLTDISPFTQLIAIIIISLTSTILIKLIVGKFQNSNYNFWYVFALLPLGLSPYFLECFSYKFDSPYMAISILVSIIPFLFYKKEEKNYLFIPIGIACTLVMCTTYQPSSGIFPSMAIILTFLMINNKDNIKDIIKFVIFSIIVFVSGILIFKLFIMEPVNNYINSNIFALKDLIPGALKNYKKYYQLVLSDFKVHWLYSIAIIILSFIITSTIKAKRNKFLVFFISLIVVILFALLSFGLYPFIQEPLFATRAMYGFGINIAILSLYAVSYKKAYIPKLCTLYLGYVLIILALTYGNALAEQKRYTDFRVNLVMNDLNNIVTNQDEKIIINFIGNVGHPNTVNNTINKNKVIERLVPSPFGQGGYWNYAYFLNYFNLQNVKKSESSLDKNQMDLVKKTRYHDIYIKDNNILVDLR